MTWRRREVVIGGACALTYLSGARIQAAPKFSDNPFKLGVASGEPTPDGVVIWTRLAPSPFDEMSGMAPDPVTLQWQVASDEGMSKVVAKGTAIADPAMGHSVHVEVLGLKPHRHYWYVFRAGSEISPKGRTRTLPAAGSAVNTARLGIVSCQKFEHGYFTGFQHLAREEIDLVVHLGDYIYEKKGKFNKVRTHHGGTCHEVEEYRARYAQYKMEGELQAAHAAHPWVVSFDDHEVTNDYAGGDEGNGDPNDEMTARRTAAYQAYYENMPLRRASIPNGPYIQMYRRLQFGNLLAINMIDTRQYRTEQPCYGGKATERCDEVFDPKAEMLGAAQEKWLYDGLGASTARWNTLAQQVIVAPRQLDENAYSMDKWDGYEMPRRRLLKALVDRKVPNPIILSGDNHRHYAADIKSEPENQDTPTIAAEYIGGSIVSRGDGRAMTSYGRRVLNLNPHFKYFCDQRGYLLATVTPQQWRTDYRIMEYVERPGAPIETRVSFATEHGQPGVTKI
jgi:alkaline phosphatase D